MGEIGICDYYDEKITKTFEIPKIDDDYEEKYDIKKVIYYFHISNWLLKSIE